MKEVVIYWLTKDQPTRWKICRRFGIYYEVTVNGETRAEIRDEDMELLREVERRGFLRIRNKKQKYYGKEI